jgi:hypothetical protein
MKLDDIWVVIILVIGGGALLVIIAQALRMFRKGD